MTQPHSQELLKMATDHFNEPIIYGSEVARLIGYGESGVDCYLIVRRLGGKIVWGTCVGGYIFLDRLKDCQPAGEWDDFKRLDSLLELNGAPREAGMRVDYQHDDMEHYSLSDGLTGALS